MMTAAELAQLAGVDVRTVRHHLRHHRLDGARRSGKIWLIPDATGAAWAAQYTPYGTLRQPRARPAA